MRPQRSGSQEPPSETPCNASPPPILKPPVPSRFTAGRSAALASSTYCAASSTLAEETRRSGLLVIASATRALSWGSSNVATQLSAMAPGRPPAFQPSVSVMLVNAPDCWRISAEVGGFFVAQPEKRTSIVQQKTGSRRAKEHFPKRRAPSPPREQPTGRGLLSTTTLLLATHPPSARKRGGRSNRCAGRCQRR